MPGFQQYGRSGDQNDLVVIDDDYEERIDVAAQIRREAAELAATWRGVASYDRDSQSPTLFEELEREGRVENSLEDDIAEVIDLTGDDIPVSIIARRATVVPSQEPTDLRSHTLPNGLVLKPGMTVELYNVIGKYDIQFLRVKSIVRQGWSSDVVIRGFGFTRTRNLDGMLDAKLNEVALVADLQSSGRIGWEEDALMDVEATNIRVERELRVTSAPFPEHRFYQSEYQRMGPEWLEHNGPLVCRYRYEMYYHADRDKPFEWALVRIGEGEADPAYKMLDSQNLNRWRGGKVPGGSHNPSGVSHPVCEVEEPQASARRTLLPGQQYTAGDVFAGAGGASRGITSAKVQLKFAVDHWEHAAETLRHNFVGTRIYDMHVTDFIESKATTCIVDILHLSPPCQFWSPAHTVAGKNDDDNIAVLFSNRDLVQKFRPRLFTVEQTFGILSPKFSRFFNMFLSGFTSLGYSVRWKVVPLANYGVPQLRKRLIIIGSAPGEKLPTFPPPTHSQNGAGGLKPWATPQSVLANLSRLSPRHPNYKLHQPEHSKRFHPPKAPWDPTKLAKTITTNGGQNYHWSGRRDFTLLEYAVLQGFPARHKFRGNYIKKQIGNAFAPSVVKVLYEHLVRWLLVQDGFHPDSRSPSSVTAISLDDDDDDDNGGGGGNGRHGDNHGDGSDDDVVYLSPDSLTPSPSGSSRGNEAGRRRLREFVRWLDRAAKDEDMEAMDLDGSDELSDTETLRDGESGSDEMDVDKDVEMVDLTMDAGKGTAEDPFVLSD